NKNNGQYPVSYASGCTVTSSCSTDYNFHLAVQMSAVALSLAAAETITTPKSTPEAAVCALLPFDATIAGQTACVCNDYGCPHGHTMTCFSSLGHMTASNGWNTATSAIVMGPSRSVIEYLPNGAGSTTVSTSQWFVGSTYNDQVDSIYIM
ncbi:hypothetical protein HK405_002277, partial [Cladochytrium tenue]